MHPTGMHSHFLPNSLFLNVCEISVRISQRGGGAPTRNGGDCANLLFGRMITENCMKMNEIGPKVQGASRGASPASTKPQTKTLTSLRTSQYIVNFWTGLFGCSINSRLLSRHNCDLHSNHLK